MSRFLVALTCCIVGCHPAQPIKKNGFIDIHKEADGATTKVVVTFPSDETNGTQQKFALNGRGDADALIKRLDMLLTELKQARDQMPIVEPKPEPKK